MFYSLQAKAAVELFGESAWALRLPALLMGMASLVLIWWLARAEVGRGAALVTLLLLTLSYHHVWFTQNARGYTGLLTWTTAATILMITGLRRPRWDVWTLYGLCLAAGMYTHLSAGFFFVAHGVIFADLLIGAVLLRPHGQVARSYPGARSYPLLLRLRSRGSADLASAPAAAGPDSQLGRRRLVECQHLRDVRVEQPIADPSGIRRQPRRAGPARALRLGRRAPRIASRRSAGLAAQPPAGRHLPDADTPFAGSAGRALVPHLAAILLRRHRLRLPLRCGRRPGSGRGGREGSPADSRCAVRCCLRPWH